MLDNIMLDLETLGLTADAVIMSIGAVRFNFETGTVNAANGFYASVSIDSNHHDGIVRRVTESTIGWWMGQNEAAKRVFSEAKVVLPVALTSLADWVGGERHLVWSCGADFDIAILRHAYETHEIDIPWDYADTRCHRTLKNLPGAPARRHEPTHHALQDAIDQAQHAIEIHQSLFLPTTLAGLAVRRASAFSTVSVGGSIGDL